MKSNPFYALSASAMLLGCWLLAEALHLQAGQLGGLLLLMAVLQLYEGLLVLLGAFLVRTGRAPRDGVTVLVLESVFLMDAPLLAAECVTANAWVGTVAALLLGVLVAGKLAWVFLAAPGLLSPLAAAVLAAPAVWALAVPVLAVHLKAAGLFGPLALYGAWWATLLLPPLQAVLHRETRPKAAPEGSRAHEIWTWVPAAGVLLHLWAVGYIHAASFQAAFLGPILLGLAATAGREQLVRQVALPGLAVLLSLGQAQPLGFRPFGAGGPLVSPLHVALLGVAATWAYLAWRDRERWLAVLAVGTGVAAPLGALAPRLAEVFGRGLRGLDGLLPRTALGWGVLTVIAAFVFLAEGARRSLGGGWRFSLRARADAVPRPRSRELAAIALASGVFAFSALAATFEAFPFDQGKRSGVASLAGLVAVAGLVIAVLAHRGAGREGRDPAGVHLARLAMATSAFGLVLALGTLGSPPPPAPRWESAALGDVRAVIAAQAAYQAANGGFYDARLDCLRTPASCIPGPARAGQVFLQAHLTSLQPRNGYRRSFVPGPPVPGAPPAVSKTSTRSFAYVAVPIQPGSSGARGFCGDGSGFVCFTADGTAPRTRPDGTCDPATCSVLR